ncbi:MAG: hypothetical protein R3A51_22820 [Nannocystaceae bacterium]|nr:hypothetical protein [Myxococcales bacterium]
MRASSPLARLLLGVCAYLPTIPAVAAEPPHGPEEPPPRPRRAREPRNFLVGLEGVAIQTPPLRPTAVRLDSRYLGNSTTLGGVGILARYRFEPLIAADLGIRSGSLRFRGDNDETALSQDIVMFEAGAVLFPARGDHGHLGIGAGWGGILNLVRYEYGPTRSGTQRYGSGLLRVGIEVEVLFSRIAFIFSLRAYGVLTDRKNTAVRGPLFEGATEVETTAPASTFQTFLVGSLGVAYRF